MKMSGGVDFKARMVIKLEENALGYLVKKWNDLEVAVEGETVVKAELAGATPAKVGQGRNRIMVSIIFKKRYDIVIPVGSKIF